MTRDARAPILTAAFVTLAAISVYGFSSRHLAHQTIWHPVGVQRFLIFLAVSTVWFAAWILARPAWMLPATVTAATIHSIAAVGLIPVAAVAFFLFACFVLGRVLLADRVPDLLAFLAGLCALMWIVTWMAHFPVNYPAVYAAILVAVLAARPRTTADCWRRLRPVDPGGRANAAMLAVALLPLLAHWLVVLKPEVSSDALSMHMVVPAYVADHRLWSFDYRHFTWAVMPMGAVWCYTAVYLLGGEFAARLLNLALLVVLCTLLYQMARRWVSPPAALLAAGLFAATPVVQLVTGSLFVETFYALMLLAALAAVWHFHDTGSRAALLLAAFLLASSMGVKLMALPFALPIGLVLAWQLLGLWRRGEKRWLPAAALVILALAPQPYLYSWWKTGNPAFPYVNSVFRSPYFPPVMSPDPRFLESLTWRTPFDITFETHRYWEGQDGSVGFQWLLLAPLVLFLVRRDWNFAEWTLAVAAWGGTLAGLLLRPNVRYLYPAFPLLALSIALLFRDGLRFRRVAWAASLACLAADLWFLPSSSFYHKTFCLNPFERDAKEHYLAEAAPVRLLVAQLNQSYPGQSALFLNTMDIAGLRGSAYSDGWHDYLFMNQVLAASSHLETFRLFQQLGIRHVVFPTPASGERIRDLELAWYVAHFTYPDRDPGHSLEGAFRLATLRPEFTGSDALTRAAAEDHPEPPVAPGVYDDYDLRIRYFDHWSHDPQFAETAGQSLTYTDIPGASFQFAFHGRALAWVYTRALNRGIASVSIDGRPRGEIDLYAPDTAWQSRTDFADLAEGDHVFEVKVQATKNPRSSGTYVDLDELIVK